MIEGETVTIGKAELRELFCAADQARRLITQITGHKGPISRRLRSARYQAMCATRGWSPTRSARRKVAVAAEEGASS